MERVFITGAAGAGKSFLAERLSEAMGLPRYCLDDMAWRPGWERVPREEFLENLRGVAVGEKWIIEGACTRGFARPVVMARADTLVWVDPPPHVLFTQLCTRTARNIATGVNICNGNVEKLSDVFSRGSIFAYSAKSWHDNRRTLGPLFEQAARRSCGVTLVRIVNRKQADRFLRQVAGLYSTLKNF